MSNTKQKKIRKKQHKPGDYILLQYPETRWGPSNKFRLLYIVDVYKGNPRGGKPRLRYTYAQIEINEDGVFESSLNDHTSMTFRSHSKLECWRRFEQEEFIETHLDLTFIVKYGGPHNLARECVEKENKKRQQALQNAEKRLEEAKRAQAILNKSLSKETEDEDSDSV